MTEETKTGKEWTGTPLDMGERLDPYGIEAFIIEYDDDNEDVFTPKRRKEFHAYELHQMTEYLGAIQASIRKEMRRRGGRR